MVESRNFNAALFDPLNERDPFGVEAAEEQQIDRPVFDQDARAKRLQVRGMAKREQGTYRAFSTKPPPLA